MKGTTAAILFGILIIGIGMVWVFTGGPARAGEDVQTPVPTGIPVTVTPREPVTSVPEPLVTAREPVTVRTTGPLPPTVVTTPASLPEKPVSADQARDHFLDIAYSATNTLERLNTSRGDDRVILSVVSPGDTDIAVLSATVKEFNDASRTVKISGMVKESSNGDIIIKFLPGSGLDTILINDIPDAGPEHEFLTRREFTYQGKPAAKVIRGTIYISNDLKGDARNHMLARALYYQMGVTGETAEYPDSLFYSGENTNTRMNAIDKKAVAILYEPGFCNSMTMEDLRKVIYIP